MGLHQLTLSHNHAHQIPTWPRLPNTALEARETRGECDPSRRHSERTSINDFNGRTNLSPLPLGSVGGTNITTAQKHFITPITSLSVYLSSILFLLLNKNTLFLCWHVEEYGSIM